MTHSVSCRRVQVRLRCKPTPSTPHCFDRRRPRYSRLQPTRPNRGASTAVHATPARARAEARGGFYWEAREANGRAPRWQRRRYRGRRARHRTPAASRPGRPPPTPSAWPAPVCAVNAQRTAQQSWPVVVVAHPPARRASARRQRELSTAGLGRVQSCPHVRAAVTYPVQQHVRP